MYHLVYISKAPMVKDEEFKKILKNARPNNLLQGISGLLLVKNGEVIQYLEGDRYKVKSLFDKICQDKRHFDVKVIFETQAESSRIFPDWKMGYINFSEKEYERGELFDQLQNLLDPKLSPEKQVLTILKNFSNQLKESPDESKKISA